MLVAEVHPDRSPLDVRRAPRVEHFGEADRVRSDDMRSEHLLPQPIDHRFEQIGHPPVQSESVETGMLAPVRA